MSDIIKFLLATGILLLGFLRKGGNVGETQESIYFQNYLQQDTADLNETEENSHSSAPLLEDKCKIQDTLCQKIESPTQENNIPYKNEIYTTTHFINTNQTITPKIIDTIKKIQIKDDINKRGYATRDTIVLNAGITQDLIEFRNLSIHELGHIFDLGVIQGKKSTKNKEFTEFNRSVFSIDDPSLLFYQISWTSENIRKKGLAKKDFCSGYGMTNPFEDFAECFNLFINHQSFFKFIATKNKNLAKKYNFIATLIQGKYKEKNTKDILLVKEDTNWRARDTTKL